MDWRSRVLEAGALLVIGIASGGCNQETVPPEAPESPTETSGDAAAPILPDAAELESLSQQAERLAAETETPVDAVEAYLAALKGGDRVKIMNLMTQRARQQLASGGYRIAPPGSLRARYAVGQVEYGDQPATARVYFSWTDVGASGPTTVEAAWTLRREEAGWRIAGMVAPHPSTGEFVELSFEQPRDLETRREQVDRQLEATARPATAELR